MFTSNTVLFTATTLDCSSIVNSVGTYRQVLHSFNTTITVCRKLKTYYIATNNMGDRMVSLSPNLWLACIYTKLALGGTE